MTAEGPPARVGSSPARVVFFGSGRFAVPLLDAVVAIDGSTVVGVVTGPDRPAGRRLVPTPTPVAVRAASLRLPVLQPTRLGDAAAVADLTALAPDIGVLADYGRLVPPVVLEIPPRGILNVHPSILPRHRGASPVASAIAAGDREAGVAIILLDAGLDTGPLIALERWPLRGDEDTPELEAEAARRGAAMLRTVVPAWLAGDLVATPQPLDGATLTRPFRREDGRLDPGRQAAELERRVRALRPWPGTFVETPAGRLGVLDAAVGPGLVDDVAGTVVADGDGLAIATAVGRLRLIRVQPAGGRSMTSAEFRRGRGRMLVGRPIGPASQLDVGESGP